MTSALLALALGASPQTPKKDDALAELFKNPPASARPHTWWHWMNGNVTKAGITADLEAMRAVGIGGAQMFTVDQSIPAGPAKYGGEEWRALTAFAVEEAGRLGLELCLHNCAGWSSSGGPWVTPADAMQVVGWSTVRVKGPSVFSEALPPVRAPQVVSAVPYARDIAVYAYPTPAGDEETRPPDFLARTGVERGGPMDPDLSPLAKGAAIPRADLVTIPGLPDAQGRLTWRVPPGDWTILRMGHVPTGKDNHPAPPEGDGLEVDKLSREAFDRFWAGLVGKVVADVGPKGTGALRDVLIDSYEVGAQNWTPRFREEFTKRRGYDPLPYLPVVTGRIVEDKERSERFLWDFRRTIADLYADNYYGRAAELAHREGMRFATEPYGNGNFDTLQSGVRADLPMGEFWLGGMAMETVKVAASVAHIAGRPVVGAESFTAGVSEGRWIEEPYTMKALGDRAFCEGVNRYIFHRYAMQPWADLKPGMTMGPWGTHLERTQTWWTEAATWLRYVARCQALLQAGTFQADVCYYVGESAPNDLPDRSGLRPVLPEGYDYDGCDTGALMRMTVRKGWVTLPSGMAYRLLVLPDTEFMTPRVARKVRDLVAAGATVYGPKPMRSPGLSGFPASDDEVRRIGNAVWNGRLYGKGRAMAGVPLVTALGVQKDFAHAPGARLISIHRKVGAADVYFVSNQRNRSARAACTFRVAGRVPELWHPETGRIEDAPAYKEGPGGTTLTLGFDAAESVFVVFRRPAPKAHLTAFAPRLSAQAHEPKIAIERARYESADGRGADVTARVRAMVEGGEFEIPATNAALGGDPVVNVVKRLVVSYRLDGKPVRRTVGENDSVELVSQTGGDLEPRPFDVRRLSDRAIEVTAWQGGAFQATDAQGRVHALTAPAPVSLAIQGPWAVRFAPNLGAPPSATFDRLVSWPSRPEKGIRYFSGSATYAKAFDVPAALVDQALRLELGAVKNFATVRLNGREVATLWKPPFAVDVTGLVRPGRNRLEVKVTNLWPNRLIGDEQLPPDADFDGDHLKRWPDWLVQGKPRPKTGRVAFATWRYYTKDSPLLESGLLGPVVLRAAKRTVLKH